MKTATLLFGVYLTGVILLCLLSLAFGGNPHTPHTMSWDFLALGITLSVVLAAASGIFASIRRIREIDGDLPAPPLEEAMSPAVLIRATKPGAA